MKPSAHRLLIAATITVTSLADSGPGSLRDAIAAAAPGDTINFSLTLPATIMLTSGELLINKNLRISGPGASSLAISGNSLSTVFHVVSGTVALSGLTIKNGRNGSGNGGGIYNAGTLILSNSTLSGNSGGIFNDTSGTLIVINSTISGNNSYTGATSYGGGMFNNSGIVALTNSTVSSNLGAVGAGIYNGGGTFTVTDSTFSSNDSRVCCGGGNGGGIYNAGGTLTVTNTTFSGNLSYYGGGIFNAGGTLAVSNSTLSGNWANNNGSDIFNSASATLKNSIMATGGPGAPGNCFLASGSFTSQGYNLSDDNSCSLTGPGDLNNTPAGLAPNGLQNNGGPTQTIAPLATSPAVNAIPLNPTNYCTDVNGAPITTDQRAVTRGIFPTQWRQHFQWQSDHQRNGISKCFCGRWLRAHRHRSGYSQHSRNGNLRLECRGRHDARPCARVQLCAPGHHKRFHRQPGHNGEFRRHRESHCKWRSDCKQQQWPAYGLLREQQQHKQQ